MAVVQKVKYGVKVAVAHLLYGVGLLQLWQRRVLRGRAVVLMYHRVLTGDERRTTGSHPGMVVTRDTFEHHMELIRRRFVPLTLQEFDEHLLRRQPFQDSSCLITFDDGWHDNLSNAMPILRKHGLPAAIFLPVNFIGSRRLFARESFTHLLMRAREAVAQDRSRLARFRALLEPAGLGQLLDLTDVDPRPAIADAIGAASMEGTIEALVGQLSAELGVGIEDLDTPDRFMDWPEVEALAREGVAFGGHGADHRRLARLAPDQVEAEVRQSQAALESRLAPATWAFAYPNGSCNPEVAATVGAAGYRLAFTTEAGTVTCDDDSLLLRRINIHEDMTRTGPMFLARVVGLF